MRLTDNDKKSFEKEFEKHQVLSRTTSAGVFKGGLADHSPEVIKLHTATHLLLASLRKVLGDQIVQKGQNITKERSRFDFPGNEKLSDVQIKKVEDMVNETIERNLPVNFKILPKDEALKTGAIHAFNEKYADTVKVYFVGDSLADAESCEFCGGPHVTHTGEIGRVRIKKQEKIGANLVRIYLNLENG
jgi:alanyl-tRNA synthetase